MKTQSCSFSADENPLESNSPAVWDRLIEAVGPASMLVVINSRMGEKLKREYSPDDIWQETLFMTWRDRKQMAWQGLASFRRLLIRIAENRIRDLVDREGAQKRGGDLRPVHLGSRGRPGSDTTEGTFAGPVVSTTPSRVAMDLEQAECMEAALDHLPEDLRQVVFLRIFEDLTLEEVAGRIGISFATVRYRLRKGAEAYYHRLNQEIRNSAS